MRVLLDLSTTGRNLVAYDYGDYYECYAPSAADIRRLVRELPLTFEGRGDSIRIYIPDVAGGCFFEVQLAGDAEALEFGVLPGGRIRGPIERYVANIAGAAIGETEEELTKALTALANRLQAMRAIYKERFGDESDAEAVMKLSARSSPCLYYSCLMSFDGPDACDELSAPTARDIREFLAQISTEYDHVSACEEICFTLSGGRWWGWGELHVALHADGTCVVSDPATGEAYPYGAIEEDIAEAAARARGETEEDLAAAVSALKAKFAELYRKLPAEATATA